MIVAIDGTAGSGKSSTARRVAEAAGFVYMDSGMLYRAVAWACIENGTRIHTSDLADLLRSLSIDIGHSGVDMRVIINHSDITDKLRTAKVSDMASRIAGLRLVRQFLFKLQRRLGDQFGESPGLVAEGRDIGTVVFPNADLKFFFSASLRTRARRRQMQWQESGNHEALENVEEGIKRRDHADAKRKLAPLKVAEGAIEVNTDQLTLNDQVDLVLSRIREHS